MDEAIRDITETERLAIDLDHVEQMHERTLRYVQSDATFVELGDEDRRDAYQQSDLERQLILVMRKRHQRATRQVR